MVNLPTVPLNDRKEERAALEKVFSKRSSLTLVYGQRRTGKSFLLRHVLSSYSNSVLFQADESAAELQLHRFVEQAASLLPEGVVANHWGTAITLLIQQSIVNGKPFILVLDEVQYLFETDPTLPSVLQRLVDQYHDRGGFHLVLCGSALGVLSRLGDVGQPLHGRFDLRLKLLPFTYEQASEFLPGYSRHQTLLTWGVFGGLARHLATLDPAKTLRENVCETLLSPLAPLAEAPLDLLRTEHVSRRSDADAVLEAIARGEGQFGNIAARTGLTANRLDYVLKELLELELIRRDARFGDRAGGKFTRYRCNDPLTTFWFRLIRPHRHATLSGGLDVIFDTRIEPRLDDHMGPMFEEAVRQAIIHGKLVPQVDNVAPWWSRDGQTELDWVFTAGKQTWVVECKWKRTELAGIEALQQVMGHLGRASLPKDARIAIVSSTGFTPGLKALAAEGIALFGPDDLW